MITVDKNQAGVIEKYIRNNFKNSLPKSNVDLLVFPEEKYYFEVLESI